MTRKSPLGLVLAIMVAAAMLGNGSTTAQGTGDAPEGCSPFVWAAINGGDLEDVAPPEGTTSSAELVFDVEAGHDGPDCDVRLNTPPVLLGGFVTPTITGVATSFHYEIVYVDLDNDPPVSLNATLDGRVTRPMQPDDPSDTNYADGARFWAAFGSEFVGDVLVPHAMAGDHWARIEAHDGTDPAQPVLIEGPRLVDTVSATLVAPNPANRFFIQPIANGPTLTPPSEAPPPAGMATEDANGAYSFFFPIDPMAADVGARFDVGTAAVFRLVGYGLLEGPPGRDSGFELSGDASVDPRAHVGEQAVNLMDTAVEAEGPGTLHVFPQSTFYRFARIGGVTLHANATSQGLEGVGPVNVWFELDADGDGAVDACVGRQVDVQADGQWIRIRLDRENEMQVFADACTVDVTPTDIEDGSTTLDDIQDDPTWGLMRLRAVRIEAAGSPMGGTTLLVDSLSIFAGIPHTNGDIDGCVYGPGPTPDAPPQPLGCVSDIGPNSMEIPAGATHGSVWAHQMLPFISTDDFSVGRPYLEPVSFSVGIKDTVLEGPSIELPSPGAARILLAVDLDGDGLPDTDTDALWDSGDLPVKGTHRLSFTVPFDVDDGIHRFVIVYDTGADEIVLLPIAVQHFTNDAPEATLDATNEVRRTVVFRPGASDPDDVQGTTAQRFGGLATWGIDFGDSESVSGTFPMPETIEHSYRTPGVYEATLVVVDAYGSTASSSVVMDLHPGH